MKKLINKFIIVTLALFLSGCTKEAVTPSDTPKETASPLTIADVKKGTIISPNQAQGLSACLAEDFSDVNTLFAEDGAAIYGEVADIEYFSGTAGLIFSILTVRVLENIKGDLNVGDEIKIVKMGGYISINEYIEGFFDIPNIYDDLCATYSQYTEEEKETHYVEFSNGTPLAKIGDQSIYYLTDSAFSSDENEYEVRGGYQGEFHLLSEGHFARIYPDTLKETGVESRSVFSESLFSDDSIYDYDELKAMIQGS